jgi:hypothetical protein
MRAVQTTSNVHDVRNETRDGALGDVEFFLSAVLGQRLPTGVGGALSAMRPRELRSLAEGLVLWTDLKGVRPTYKDAPEVLRWLFPERFGP